MAGKMIKMGSSGENLAGTKAADKSTSKKIQMDAEMAYGSKEVLKSGKSAGSKSNASKPESSLQTRKADHENTLNSMSRT